MMAPVEQREEQDSGSGLGARPRERRCIVTGRCCRKPGCCASRWRPWPGGSRCRGQLPGRGLWVSAERAAIAKRCQAVSSRGRAKAPTPMRGLPSARKASLVERMLAHLGLPPPAGIIGVRPGRQGFCAARTRLLSSRSGGGRPDGSAQTSGRRDGRAMFPLLSEPLTNTELSLARGGECGNMQRSNRGGLRRADLRGGAAWRVSGAQALPWKV